MKPEWVVVRVSYKLRKGKLKIYKTLTRSDLKNLRKENKGNDEVTISAVLFTGTEKACDAWAFKNN